MALHRAYPLWIGAQEIDGLRPPVFSDGILDRRPDTDGSVDPTNGYIVSDNPRLSFSTLNIYQVLATVGFAGVEGDVTWFDAKMAAGGAYESGSNHIQNKLDNATTFLRTVSARYGEDAVASCESFGWNSSTHPMSRTVSSALSAHTPSNLAFTVGIVKINGVSYTGVVSIDVNAGIREAAEPGDNQTWPKSIVIARREPIITVQVVDPTQIAGVLTSTVSGKAIASDTCVYFQKRSTGGRLVAAATAEHIKITVAAGYVYATGNDSDPRTATFAIVPKKGVADSIQISTASAMS